MRMLTLGYRILTVAGVGSSAMSERNPFDELDELFDRMQRNMERATRMGGLDSLGEIPGVPSMRVDLEDRDEEFVLTGDLPGYDADDIDLRVDDQTLHVAAERDDATEETAGDFVHRERRRTSVERSVPPPSAVDTDAVTAAYDNGVLTVRLPKTDPESSGTRIDVN